MGICCCNRYFYETEKKTLINSYHYHNRVLEYGTCPHCNSLVAEITSKNIDEKTIREDRKRNKKAKVLINKCLSEKHQDYYRDVKYGSKTNMQWLYQIIGTIKDFNNTKVGTCKTELTTIKAEYSNAPLLAGAFS